MAIPPPDDGYGDAAVSLWTTRVVAFTQWVGPGRRVTQTGRLTLAQARELVPALDTGDVIDPMVHGRVHRTTSTEELPELNTTCAWAKAARLVRVTGGKLAVVQKNAVLLERPVPLWERMFATFGALGPVICPPGWGESLLRGHFADGIRAVLSGVSAHDGPAGLDLVCRWGWDAVSHGGRIAGVSAANRDTWRRCNDRDVRAAVGVLARFGALRLDGPPDAYVVALTRWDAPRCPHAGEVRPGRRSPAEAHRSLRHRSLPRAEPDLSGRARAPRPLRPVTR